MSQQQSPEQRATEAAEALAAEGASVTARAVRERSGVRMTVAAEAARSWNEQEAQEESVPKIPEVVQVRLEAAWREAVKTARGEFAEARAGWQGRVDEVASDRDALAKEVEAVEAERDQANHDLEGLREQAHAEVDVIGEKLAEQRSRADKAEARAEATEAERDRLLTERNTLLAERDGLRDQVREVEKASDPK